MTPLTQGEINLINNALPALQKTLLGDLIQGLIQGGGSKQYTPVTTFQQASVANSSPNTWYQLAQSFGYFPKLQDGQIITAIKFILPAYIAPTGTGTTEFRYIIKIYSNDWVSVLQTITTDAKSLPSSEITEWFFEAVPITRVHTNIEITLQAKAPAGITSVSCELPITTVEYTP